MISPGADGELDFTESLTGDVKYKNRMITINLTMIEDISLWSEKISELQNYLHGKRLKIIFDDDLNYYYVGRITVNEFESDKNIKLIVLQGNAEPYKYDVASSTEDWLWDPFDFENGIINETKDLVVDRSLDVTIVGKRKRVVPKFNCSTEMKLIFNGITFTLPKGESYSPYIEIVEGENNFRFIGDGTVTIEYRGGSL